MSEPVVDIHCHTFNADDLPVHGFLRKVVLDEKLGSGLAGRFVDLIAQRQAPGYEEERRRLGELEADRSGVRDLTAPVIPELGSSVTAEYERLRTEQPELIAELHAASGSRRDVIADARGFGPFDQVKAWIAFAVIMTDHRVDNTIHLVREYGDSVDLFTPMLVDLQGLEDEPSTSLRQQIELQAHISRLSMRGELPGVERARIHPFVGYDPRRSDGLELAEYAVEECGFIGVKVYPPMGFRPLDNGDPEIDRRLRDFYRWCRDEQVPITAHGNSTKGARKEFDRYSDPQLWGRVLHDFDGLHLNLGHFGGDEHPNENGWPRGIAELAATPGVEHLYADVGMHDTREVPFENYLGSLRAILDHPDTSIMRQRLMYGSDWNMLAMKPYVGSFKDTYERAIADLGEETRAGFMGRNALSFLGFDDSDNKNTRRLAAYYAAHAPERLPDWLARSGT